MGWDFGGQSSHLHIRCLLLTTASSPHVMLWKHYNVLTVFFITLLKRSVPNVCGDIHSYFFLFVLDYFLATCEWEEKTPGDQAVQ